MIEARVIEYLTDAVGLPVYAEQPEDMPEEFLVVEKTGSSMENWIHSALIAIQSYADSMYRAAEINASVREAMWHIEEETDIFGCSLNSDYNFTDTEQKKYRYQAVFDITYHE